MRIIIAVWALFLIACASQTLSQKDGATTTTQPNSPETVNRDGNTTVYVDAARTGLSLADYLRKVPGLMVRGSGNDISITIRGVNSIQAGTEPLFVVNGLAVNGDYASVASFLNPNDIERVEVLKDASATGAWGVRGANGVILIKTR